MSVLVALADLAQRVLIVTVAASVGLALLLGLVGAIYDRIHAPRWWAEWRAWREVRRESDRRRTYDG